MEGNKKIYKSLKYMTMLTQLGISVVAPLILCIPAAIWIKSKLNLGDWVVLVGVMLGIASGCYSFWQSLKKFIKDMHKEQEEYKKSMKE